MPDLEEMAEAALELTRQNFGRTIGLYAPLYLSNYCDNHCVYCGFHSKMKIERRKLSANEIEKECRAIKDTGIQNILLLTGESKVHSPVNYIKEAVAIAQKYFPNIALEIYPLETAEYCELYLAGADGVTLYQETYDEEVYRKLHLSGKKRDYQYRLNAPERMAEAGIRHISMGVLLGLTDWRKDIAALFDHLDRLWKKYPGVEYSLSFPRLQKLTGEQFDCVEVTDSDMLEIIASARLRFPRAGINLSTRERPEFRDNIMEYGVTRMSAGSLTTVGGYAEKKNDPGQFTVNDNRSLNEIKKMLVEKGYDPVITDWRKI
jgi:2-iminoacetate synthase